MRPADSDSEIFRNPNRDLSVPEDPEFITGCSECLSFGLNCIYLTLQ